MKKNLRSVVVPIVFTALFVTFCITKALYHADMLLCDVLYRKFESKSRDVKIITIDEKCEAEYGKFENWSREKSAELTELLYKNPDTAPAVLVYDIMFIGDSEKQIDQRLAAACRKAGNVVCASNLVYQGKMEKATNGAMVFDPSAIDYEEKPFAALSEVACTGFANTCISEDNIIRYAQLYADKDGERLYSLAYAAYRSYAEKKELPVIEPKTNGGQSGFFYSGKPGEVPHISLVDVLAGRVPVSEFDDCLVFVGVYAPGFQDAYNTSALRGRQMYGVEINANIMLALLNGKLANPVSSALYLTVASAVFLLWLFYMERQRIRISALQATLLIATHMALGRILAIFGYLLPQIYFVAAFIAGLIYLVLHRYVLERIQHRHAIQTLKKYVAPQIVDKLSKNGNFELQLGGEKKHVAVLFVDIRGFTTMSETLSPEEVVRILNQYLSVTTAAVFKNDGTLDKFIGDATMAIFNAPFDLEDYIFKAVKTAWDIREGVWELAKGMTTPIHVGVGVNCGEAVVGNIGCETRMDYTAIGDTVNTAARLESNAKAGTILISKAVYDALEGRISADPIGELSLKGKAEKTSVYRVTGFLAL